MPASCCMRSSFLAAEIRPIWPERSGKYGCLNWSSMVDCWSSPAPRGAESLSFSRVVDFFFSDRCVRSRGVCNSLVSTNYLSGFFCLMHSTSMWISVLGSEHHVSLSSPPAAYWRVTSLSTMDQHNCNTRNTQL